MEDVTKMKAQDFTKELRSIGNKPLWVVNSGLL